MHSLPLIPVAYILIAYGVMQAIAYSHRLVADWREGIRFIAAIALFSALIFGALIAVGQTGQLSLRVATLLSFTALLISLADLAHLNPKRRFAPVSSILLIISGTVLLKTLPFAGLA
ncbi:MAG: hypothetical protein AAGE80_04100 [Pseudomonadota bacterium]